MPIKTGWRDAHAVPWNLAEAICQNIIYKKPIVFNGLSTNLNLSVRRAGSEQFPCQLKGCKFPLMLATCNLAIKMGFLLKKWVLTSTILVPLDLIMECDRHSL